MDTIRASFPLTAAQARAVQEAYARSRQLPVDFDLRLTPDVSIQLRLIPPGEFIMGLEPEAFAKLMALYPEDDKWPENRLFPHLVQIDTPLYSEAPP